MSIHVFKIIGLNNTVITIAVAYEAERRLYWSSQPFYGGISMTNVLRKAEVLRRLGVSKSTLARWVEAGHFPKPLQIGPRAVGWCEGDLVAFLATRSRAGGAE